MIDSETEETMTEAAAKALMGGMTIKEALENEYRRGYFQGMSAMQAAAPELLAVINAFVDETVDYMTRNKLGDPEQQHNVKWARAVIAKAEQSSTGGSVEQ